MRPLEPLMRVAKWFAPTAVRWAYRERGRFAVVCNVGRRSGRVYETPVQAVATPGGYAVHLLHGTDVQWLENIRTAGHCARAGASSRSSASMSCRAGRAGEWRWRG